MILTEILAIIRILAEIELLKLQAMPPEERAKYATRQNEAMEFWFGWAKRLQDSQP